MDRSLGLSQNCCPGQGDLHAAATTSQGGSRTDSALRSPDSSRCLACPPCRPPFGLKHHTEQSTQNCKTLFAAPVYWTVQDPEEPTRASLPLGPASFLAPASSHGAARRLRLRVGTSFLRVHCVCFAGPARGRPGTASLWPPTGFSPVQVMQPILVSSVFFFPCRPLFIKHTTTR